MFNLLNGNKFGKNEKMIPRFDCISLEDGTHEYRWAGKTIKVLNCGEFGVEEPETFKYDSNSVLFLKDSALDYVIALYNLLCHILNLKHAIEWTGYMLKRSELELNVRDCRTMKLVLANVITKRRQKVKVLPVIQKRMTEEELVVPSIQVSEFQMMHCSLPSTNYVLVNCEPPIDVLVDRVEKPKEGAINVYLGNYQDALDCVASKNVPIVFLGEKWLPGCTRHMVGLRCMSWHGVCIDKDKLPTSLKTRPFIYKDWVVDGNYVVDEKEAAEVLSNHLYLARSINVSTLSTNPAVIQAIETADVVVPDENMTYVFRNVLRRGFSHYVSIDVGHLGRWAESKWQYGSMKVLQYSFVRIPGTAWGQGVLREKTEEDVYWFYAFKSRLIHVSGPQTGRKHIRVYNCDVVEKYGENWAQKKVSDLSHYECK